MNHAFYSRLMALVFAVSFVATTTVARADVCFKNDDKHRINVFKQKDGRISFVYYTDRMCSGGIGPHISYSPKDLFDLRISEKGDVTSGDVSNGIGGLIALFTFTTALAAAQEGATAPLGALENGGIPKMQDTKSHKENAEALDPAYFTPGKCRAPVGGKIEYHLAVLNRALASTPAPKLEESAAPKKASPKKLVAAPATKKPDGKQNAN